MDALERVKQSRMRLAVEAAQRWSAHEGPRQEGLSSIREHGPGAADSWYRQMRHSTRKSIVAEATQRIPRDGLPLALERKLGPMWEVYNNAPSEAARLAGKPVARIVTSCDPKLQAYGFGTGFMVSKNLLLTNNHVFPSAESAQGTGANFLYEVVENQVQLGVTFELDPDSFFVTNTELDYTLIAIKERSITGESLSELGMIALIEATAKILRGYPVNIIQYANGNPKGFAYEGNMLLDILDEGFLHYETDTDTGSSGAPVYSGDWELVALHHASVPRVANGRILTKDGSAWEEGMPDEDIDWIANEGIRISSIVRSLESVKLVDPRQRELLSMLLSNTGDPVDDLASTLIGMEHSSAPASFVPGSFATTTSHASNAMPTIQATFTGPVTINIAGGTQSGNTPVPTSRAAVPVALEAAIRFDPDYDNREGYDPDFLGYGLKVPMPTVSDARMEEMYRENGKVVVLPYHHFSLAMNADRRMMMWSAANTDYDKSLRDPRKRTAWGSDKWIGDPRVPAELQLFDPDIYKPAKQIDRGHIVRREDNAWGDDLGEIEYANSDTFHWTNCTPQHTAFNQSSPGKEYPGVTGLWGAFEDHIKKNLKNGEESKACIFSGPVLAKNDRHSEEYRSGKVKYPTRFWKVVFVAEPDDQGGASLRGYGFVLSQADVVRKFGIEFDPAQYGRFQKPLAEISDITGVVFDDVLLAADAAN